MFIWVLRLAIFSNLSSVCWPSALFYWSLHYFCFYNLRPLFFPSWDLQLFFLDIMHQITLSYFIYMLRRGWLVHIYVLNTQTYMYLSCEFNLFLNVFLKVKFTLKEMLNSYNCEVIDHQCSNFLFWFWQFLLLVLISRVRYFVWRVWRYQMGNHNPYIEEEQKTQWSKEKVQKDKQRSTNC